MTPSSRLGLVAFVLSMLVGCGDQSSHTVLSKTIGVNLAEVESFIALSGPSGSGQSLRAALTAVSSSTSALEAGSQPGPQLLALTQSDEVLEISLVEQGNPQSDEAVTQPPVMAIFPTASWVLFSTPGFDVTMDPGDGRYFQVLCSMIAARRADGALFCSSLLANNDWAGRELDSSIFANAAGDVVYTMADVALPVGEMVADSHHLYKIALGGAEGPIATPALDFSLFQLDAFRVNGAGDLFVNYFPTALGPAARSLIIPVNGGEAFTVQGTHNRNVIAGEVGQADEDSFYVGLGSGDGEEAAGTIRIVTKAGSSFVETQEVINLANVGAYTCLFRLSDGVYMFSPDERALVRVIADGALIADPTPITLVGVDRVLGIDGRNMIFPVGGRWVFIAATGNGYKFVRHDGTSQQDIPFDATIDVRSFTVSTSGAIDFLGFRVGTSEKIRGSVAAGSTEVTISSAGVVDPAQVVAFTQIN